MGSLRQGLNSSLFTDKEEEIKINENFNMVCFLCGLVFSIIIYIDIFSQKLIYKKFETMLSLFFIMAKACISSNIAVLVYNPVPP